MAIPYSYNEVMQVSVADAKNKLPELIKIAEGGEPVTICRRGVPVVDLVRTDNSSRQKPRFGTLRGRIKINDPNWWHPMSQDEVDAMLGTSDE
jgi:prevent-host-death family protein